MTRIKITTVATISFLSIFLFFVSINQLNSPEKNNQVKETEIVQSIESPYVKEFTLPKGSFPNGILMDGKGFVWIVGSDSRLYKFDPKGNKLDSVYVIGDDSESKISKMGWTIVEDNDGFLWLSQLGPQSLWRFDPAGEKFSPYDVGASPFQMKVDKEKGNVWFTTLGGNSLGVIQKLNEKGEYKIKEFNLGNDTFPSGLFLEKDHVWVAQVVGNTLTKFKIKFEGDSVASIEKMWEFPSDNKTKIYSPTDIFVKNNEMWFTEHGRSTISKYIPSENEVKRFPTSRNAFNATTLPFWIKGSEGDGMWINEHTGNKIAFFNTTDLTLTEFGIPTNSSDGSVVYPLGLAVTPHSVWFSEWNADKIAVIKTEKPIPFDIKAEEKTITIPRSSEGSRIIDLEILRNENYERPISLMVSSSMEPSLGLVNMTATFTEQEISFDGTSNKRIQLMITSNSAPSGNYTLAISASDGFVTKSAFVEMTVE